MNDDTALKITDNFAVNIGPFPKIMIWELSWIMMRSDIDLKGFAVIYDIQRCLCFGEFVRNALKSP